MNWRELQQGLASTGYIADGDLAMAVALMGQLERPLLIEGETGVGKTEIAKALATVLGTRLIRLQCYEGLDANAAVYEWNYQRQLLAIKVWENEGVSADEKESHVFEEKFLLKRPLLEAITQAKAPVLLVDEIDRADEEFEAYLLEVLSDYQISIPEMGTVEAVTIPRVILTSNSTRELSDALKRRCLYLWIDYPTFDKEMDILGSRVPGIRDGLAQQVCGFMQLLRNRDFYKRPGIAETIDWALALLALDTEDLDPGTVEATLGCVLKYKEDIEKLQEDGIHQVIEKAQALKDRLVDG